ncbi:MAG: tRNA preQ1(34) S-adenosylmethionine ribosyltransferase-isomerase QueA [Firmicutes bacterium]|nr:tRNA preQ1(34) S-adenosylmethionine ribosyltransferase-isomerase QueA [Bacillota bacterium]
MNTDDYDYVLPERLIAQSPIPDRSASRMLVVDKQAQSWRHDQFAHLPQLLSPGDLLIANDSRVLPARLYGVKEATGAAIELLLLRPHADGLWEVLARPGKRLKTGDVIAFGDGVLRATMQEGGEQGTRIVAFSDLGEALEEQFERLGEMPLPPYIHEKLPDRERYQTVYARAKGSVAAPTAGLHFTTEILDSLRARGVAVEFLTLHVGLGTFRPVQVEHVEEHHMHAEFFSVPVSLLHKIEEVRGRGGRVLSVGTTTVRALESAARAREQAVQGMVSGWTDIFLYPGVPFLATDALLTNFHLPKSTLLMLVSALSTRELMLDAYRAAVEAEYRFFSFGDAMLIW